MNARALPWFEDNDPRDLRRWAIAAAIVVGIHAAAIGSYLYVHQPDEIGDEETAVAVDFSAGDDAIDQAEVAPTPEPPQQQEEEKPPPPPPPDTSDAVIEPPPPPKVENQPPPTPYMPALSKGGTPVVQPGWETGLVRHLQKFKRYPSNAQSRGEEGIVLLSFSVDRTGHVLAHSISRSSGFPDLDAEVMSMIERAQPLPPFPADMPEAKLDLTVPIRFSLR